MYVGVLSLFYHRCNLLFCKCWLCGPVNFLFSHTLHVLLMPGCIDYEEGFEDDVSIESGSAVVEAHNYP